MDSIYEATMLYDFYGELLTDNQKRVCRLHILEDYSLGEVAEMIGVSRQGVHDSLKRALGALKGYESTLHLVERFQSSRERLTTIRRLAAEAKSADEAGRAALLDRIAELTEEIG